MPVQTLLALIQARQLIRNNQVGRSLVTEDEVTTGCNVILIQSRKMFSQTSLNWKTLAKLFRRLCQSLVHAIEISQEPKASWKCDRKGRLYLKIYDPSTKKHYSAY